MTKLYNPENITLQMSEKLHTDSCSIHKTTEMWLWVSKEDFTKQIKDLYPFAHSIGDCIGYHEHNTPASEMRAKVVFTYEENRYAMKNPDYKEYKCDCDGEVIFHNIEGFSENTFLNITPKEK